MCVTVCVCHRVCVSVWGTGGLVLGVAGEHLQRASDVNQLERQVCGVCVCVLVCVCVCACVCVFGYLRVTVCECEYECENECACEQLRKQRRDEHVANFKNAAFFLGPHVKVRRAHTHTHRHTLTHTHAHAHTHTHLRTLTHTVRHTHTKLTHRHTHLHTLTQAHSHTHARTLTHTRAHTHTHTHTPRPVDRAQVLERCPPDDDDDGDGDEAVAAALASFDDVEVMDRDYCGDEDGQYQAFRAGPAAAATRPPPR